MSGSRRVATAKAGDVGMGYESLAVHLLRVHELVNYLHMCALVHYMMILVKCEIAAYGMRKVKYGMVPNGMYGTLLRNGV